LEGRKPFGVRLKPLQSRTIDGANKKWKVSSLLKKNNKTAPIMEENEEAHEEIQSSESEHMSVPHNSWVNPGPEENTDSLKLTNSSFPTTKSPINLWTMPLNGNEQMEY